jgi:hypothetical protein
MMFFIKIRDVLGVMKKLRGGVENKLDFGF